MGNTCRLRIYVQYRRIKPAPLKYSTGLKRRWGWKAIRNDLRIGNKALITCPLAQ